MFRTFIRSWFRDNPEWPDGIEPYPGRRTYKKTYKTKREAQNACARWNAQNKAGKYSRRMDYEQIKTTVMEIKKVLDQITDTAVIDDQGKKVPFGFLVPLMDPISIEDSVRLDAIEDLFKVLKGNIDSNVSLYVKRLPGMFKFQFVENFRTSPMATQAALGRNTQIMKN